GDAGPLERVGDFIQAVEKDRATPVGQEAREEIGRQLKVGREGANVLVEETEQRRGVARGRTRAVQKATEITQGQEDRQPLFSQVQALLRLLAGKGQGEVFQ